MGSALDDCRLMAPGFLSCTAQFETQTSGCPTDPLWRHDGRRRYYRLGDQMMVVDISHGPSLEAAKPRVLCRGNYLAGAGSSCRRFEASRRATFGHEHEPTTDAMVTLRDAR